MPPQEEFSFLQISAPTSCLVGGTLFVEPGWGGQHAITRAAATEAQPQSIEKYRGLIQT